MSELSRQVDALVDKSYPALAGIGATSLREKPGYTDMEPDDLARFTPIDGVTSRPGSPTW